MNQRGRLQSLSRFFLSQLRSSPNYVVLGRPMEAAFEKPMDRHVRFAKASA